MRILFALLSVLLLPPLQVAAFPLKGEIRDLAYQGDVDGVEQTFQDAFEAALAESSNQDNLREAMTVFSVADPRMWDFVEDWRQEYPDSPFAMSARAWQHYRLGWWVRGDEMPSRTYPLALRRFNIHHQSAMVLAQEAYALAPALLPASDAVFRMQMTTSQLSDADWLAMLRSVMTQNGNIGTLHRAADHLNPNWGGAGLPGVIALCTEFAGQVQDVDDFSEDICVAYLVYNGVYPSPLRREWLDRVRHTGTPLLNLAIERASWPRGVTIENVDEVRAYLEGIGSDDYGTANEFLHGFSWTDQDISTALSIVERHRAAAEEELEFSRYDPRPIGILLESYGFPGGQRLELDAARRIELMRARLKVSPYNPDHWIALAYTMGLDAPFQNVALRDDYYTNAIVYSNHSPYMLRYFMDTKMGEAALYANTRKLEEEIGQSIIPEGTYDFEEAVACPLIRVMRVMVLICSERQNDPACHDPFAGVNDDNEISNMARDAMRVAQCWGDASSLFGEVFYEEVPFPELTEF